jgi:uncharacterized repeat protein (TIGR03803 family)
MVANLSRLLRRSFLCVALAGCSNGTTVSPPISADRASGALAPPSVRAATAKKPVKPVDTVVYNFQGATGAYPSGTLLDVNGALFGTTSSGGADNFEGTVFMLTTSGNETVLHSFGSGTDGSDPMGALVALRGTLYGTTNAGGAHNLGTVFSITTSGVEKVLYSFKGGADGSGPDAGLLVVDGVLYGTTSGGGANGFGTVFRVGTGGKEKVLYSFKGGTDGSNPQAALINVNGKLYGTTAYGGGSTQCNGGCGTVFSTTTSGSESVFYSFRGGFADGSLPEAALLDVSGTLYGTAYRSGAGNLGIVFAIGPAGTETVLHSFEGTDGAYPYGELIDVNGTLYGTTDGGGPPFDGTVFSITTAGVESVVYSLNGPPSDGKFARTGLIDVGGLLYGTSQTGGTDSYGTVFSVTP